MKDVDRSSSVLASRSEVFRGSLKECLAHFLERLNKVYPSGSMTVNQGRQPIADFCKVGIHTVYEWGRPDSGLPPGVIGFRLACFLELQGYSVVEVTKLEALAKRVVELLGFTVIKPHQLQESLGFRNTSVMYAVLRGKRNMAHGKIEQMARVIQKHSSELDTRKEECRRKFIMTLGDEESITPGSADDSIAHETDLVPPNEDYGVAIPHFLRGLLALLRSERGVKFLRQDERLLVELTSELNRVVIGILGERS